MTDVTNTNAANAAALAVRNAAAALARRRPLYYGSGEPADEDLAQAIEYLPLPDVDVTDWKAEAERLRGLLSREQQERHAMLGRLDAALANLAQAREVLRELEWCELPHAYYGVAVRCPHCGGLRSDGHDPECPLSAAIAAKGE